MSGADSTANDWYVCHTRPRREKKFAALMEAEGFEHYLPLIDSIRRYPSGTKRFTKPLFAGYVFARVGAEHKARMYQQELIARAIPVDHEARLRASSRTCARSSPRGSSSASSSHLVRGRQVKVVGGALRSSSADSSANSSSPRGIVISGRCARIRAHLLRIPAERLKALP